ncbi:MAG: PorP/SprF family type IX secretion system membrane protein [Cytophagales bacterium]|nr:PorP/SprF family type IX secretion system membrane protein [Cytophagales bacterium]
MRTPIVALLVLLLLARHAAAQFRPYTLFPLSPPLTNPALVAAGDYAQATAHYRASRGAGYQVPSLSYVHPLYGKARGHRYGGMGFTLISQSAGPADLYRVTGALGGFGYHVPLGSRHALAAGLQLGLVNQRIDPGAVTTDSQYGAGGYDPSLGNGETFDQPNRTAVAANAGLHWSCTDPAGNRKAALGLALYNANRPAYPFLRERNRQPAGYILTGSLLAARRGNFTVEPTFRYFREGLTGLGSVGAGLGYAPENRRETKLSATLWYHTSVSPGLSLQLETEKLVLGLAADGSSYRAGRAEAGNSAFEVALAWRMHRKKQVDRRHAAAEPLPEAQPLPTPDQTGEKTLDTTAATPQPAAADPASTPAPSERQEERLARQIPYPLGGTGLSAADEQFLDSLARELKAHPDWQLRIDGHTCSLGSRETNEKVSLRRARFVQRRLVQKGVPATQLRAAGHADRYPIAPNDTEAGRAKNRRVEFVMSVIK